MGKLKFICLNPEAIPILRERLTLILLDLAINSPMIDEFKDIAYEESIEDLKKAQ